MLYLVSGMQCSHSIFVILGNLCSEMPSWAGWGDFNRSESWSTGPVPLTELVRQASVTVTSPQPSASHQRELMHWRVKTGTKNREQVKNKGGTVDGRFKSKHA